MENNNVIQNAPHAELVTLVFLPHEYGIVRGMASTMEIDLNDFIHDAVMEKCKKIAPFVAIADEYG